MSREGDSVKMPWTNANCSVRLTLSTVDPTSLRLTGGKFSSRRSSTAFVVVQTCRWGVGVAWLELCECYPLYVTTRILGRCYTCLCYICVHVTVSYTKKFYMYSISPQLLQLVNIQPMRNWTGRTISSFFLCRKLHLFLGKSTKTAAIGALLFDSNIHQIVCRLRLHPDPTGGAYNAPPDPLPVI